MRILFFMPFATRTGSEVALLNLICYAADKGWNVAVACRTEGTLLRQLPQSVPVFVHSRSGAFQRFYMGARRRLLRDPDSFPLVVHAKFKPDVWYVNTILQPRIVRQAETKGIPCALHTHELEQIFRSLSERETREIVEYPQLIVAGAKAAADVFHALGRKRGIEVCYETIDPRNVHWEAAISRTIRQEMNIGDQSFVWTMSGTRDPNKNPVRFVKLAREMLRAGHDVHFMWLGGEDTGYSLYARGLAEQLGIANNVHWVGARSEDYYDYLNAADGLVLTSTHETFSLVTIEAAHLGKPVVSLNSGGIKEMIRPGMGAVVESWNDGDLVRAMVAVMQGEIPFDPLVATERAKEFSIAVQGERWMNLMQKYFAG